MTENHKQKNSCVSDLTFDYLVGTDAVEAVEVHAGRDDGGEDEFEVEEEEEENVDEEDFEEGVEDTDGGIMEDESGLAIGTVSSDCFFFTVGALVL